jgi:hypothetical protein
MTLIPADLRAAAVARAGDRCEYCRLGQESQVATFPVDHIIPVASGGRTELENLALACPRCNARKWTYVSAADPVTGGLVPLFNPRAQAWADHFRWSDTDPAVLEPTSASARATAALLDLNSPQHLAIRRWLMAIGMFPPR